mmetsp:Transcript_28055/g.64220  ORF Transcript_28055/g.64220 Transcript_28055/m.64220 type:complete len:398 (-) Transcript_28055:355-1548(-)
MMISCFLSRTHYVLAKFLLVSPIYCTSFLTTQRSSVRHNHNGNTHKSWSQIRNRPGTLLWTGRDRETPISTHRNRCAEKNLVSAEEAARQKRVGQMKQRLQKEAKREDRTSALELKLKKSETMSQSDSERYMPKDERAELEGLLKVRDTFAEQYNPETFTKEHLDFKAMHNDAFIGLSKFCQNTRNESEPANVFFLDGPDGGTASALIQRGGFDPSQCYVANRHNSTCVALRRSGGGLLPDENVVHATASEALTISEPISVDGLESSNVHEDGFDVLSLTQEDGAFAHKDFIAYYFDGCGGFVPHIVGMLSAALLRKNFDGTGPIAVGYSLLGGNKDVVTKELVISRALTTIARTRGMQIVHVLDDPLRYGLSSDIQKIGGSNDGTFSTWLLLKPIN